MYMLRNEQKEHQELIQENEF